MMLLMVPCPGQLQADEMSFHSSGQIIPGSIVYADFSFVMNDITLLLTPVNLAYMKTLDHHLVNCDALSSSSLSESASFMTQYL